MKNIFVLVAIFMFLSGVSLKAIQTSSHIVQIRREFNASFDKTWESVLKYINAKNNVLISKDKASGVITFKSSTFYEQKDEYINVFLTENKTSDKTVVFYKPFTALWKSNRKLQLHSVRPSMSASEHDFFKELEKIIIVENNVK